MGLFGLGKGIWKTVEGVFEGDLAKAIKGLIKAGVNGATTVTTFVSGDIDEAVSGDDAEALDD